MASSFVTVSAPFFSYRTSFHPLSNKCPQGLKAISLKVNAIATKYEPSKVVPQADRVLIRLEELPEILELNEHFLRAEISWRSFTSKSSVKFERYLVGEVLCVGTDAGELEKGKKVMFSDINAYEVDLGTDGKHVFCKAGDLLAVIE